MSFCKRNNPLLKKWLKNIFETQSHTYNHCKMIEMLPNEPSCNGDRGGEPQSIELEMNIAFLFLKKCRLKICFSKIICVFKLCLFQKWNWGRVRHANNLQIFRELSGERWINYQRGSFCCFFFPDELWHSGQSKDFWIWRLSISSPPYYLCFCGKGIWPTKVFILLTCKVRVTLTLWCEF